MSLAIFRNTLRTPILYYLLMVSKEIIFELRQNYEALMGGLKLFTS